MRARSLFSVDIDIEWPDFVPYPFIAMDGDGSWFVYTDEIPAYMVSQNAPRGWWVTRYARASKTTQIKDSNWKGENKIANELSPYCLFSHPKMPAPSTAALALLHEHERSIPKHVKKIKEYAKSSMLPAGLKG